MPCNIALLEIVDHVAQLGLNRAVDRITCLFFLADFPDRNASIITSTD